MACKNCEILQQRIAELEDQISGMEDAASTTAERLRLKDSELRRTRDEARDAEYFREDQARRLAAGDAPGAVAERLRRGW